MLPTFFQPDVERGVTDRISSGSTTVPSRLSPEAFQNQFCSYCIMGIIAEYSNIWVLMIFILTHAAQENKIEKYECEDDDQY